MSKQSNKYARNRKFKYPDYHVDPYSKRRSNSEEYEFDYLDRISPGYEDNIYDQEDDQDTAPHGCQRDHYAALGELACDRGDYEAAFEAFRHSVIEYRNIESIKRLGEMFCKAFTEMYQEGGYDGHDQEGMILVKGAIGMFIAYVSFGGDSSSIEENFNNIASVFCDINVFAAICAEVKTKCRGMDFNTFINQFNMEGN